MLASDIRDINFIRDTLAVFFTEQFWSAPEREGLKACIVGVPLTFPGKVRAVRGS